MFEYINENSLYSKQGQERFKEVVQFPSGMNPKDGGPGRMGAVMVKVSWRILDRDKDKDLTGRFHTADALVYFPGPPATKAGIATALGLVGFHVGHKTNFAPQFAPSCLPINFGAQSTMCVRAKTQAQRRRQIEKIDFLGSRIQVLA
jgi:hypothetical protein